MDQVAIELCPVVRRHELASLNRRQERKRGGPAAKREDHRRALDSAPVRQNKRVGLEPCRLATPRLDTAVGDGLVETCRGNGAANLRGDIIFRLQESKPRPRCAITCPGAQPCSPIHHHAADQQLRLDQRADPVEPGVEAAGIDP